MKTVDLILQKVKRQGTVTAKQLSVDLNITTMGARQHLLALEEDGILSFHDIKAKVGRPTRHWTLTAKGHAQFTDRHGELAIQFIDAIETLYGNEGVEKITLQREEKALETYQTAMQSGQSLQQKLQILCELRDQEGYMVELEVHPDHFLLIENHCPICQAAKRCPSLCHSEQRIFKQVLKEHAFLERSEHIVSGQRRCVYKISPLG
jgi:predicted ArsR family transcriptional regulator